MSKLYPYQRLARRVVLGVIVGAFSISPFGRGKAAASDRAAMFRNTLDHSGVYPDSSSGVYGGVLWRKQTGAAERSTPTIAGGVVFVGSSDGNLYALDANTGHGKWTFGADSAVASSATVASGRVFFSSYKGTFYAVNFADGKL